jgi:hypothetical protein
MTLEPEMDRLRRIEERLARLEQLDRKRHPQKFIRAVTRQISEFLDRRRKLTISGNDETRD